MRDASGVTECQTPFDNWVDLLRHRADHEPTHPIFTFLEPSKDRTTDLTYAQLDSRARAIAAHIGDQSGKPVLLLFPPGLDYLAAFFGCLYAGAVAVPAYPPNPNRLHRSVPRLRGMITDARIELVLTTHEIAAFEKRLSGDGLPAGLRWIACDTLGLAAADRWQRPAISGDALAFLQYTSGSTGTPKGVMVSHGNLIHNEIAIQRGFGTSAADTIVSWLPLYHDMGLIGGILHPLWLGARCYFMSPMDFLRRPFRWLETISQTGATVSGAPDFAYALCARRVSDEERDSLDLSRWQVAFNGAEPVRAQTLDAFAAKFAPVGFSPNAFYPCYGLAEATLFVSGGNRSELPARIGVEPLSLERDRVNLIEGDDVRLLISSGAAEQQVRIVDLAEPRVLDENQVGEIWVQGPSVAGGYYLREEATAETFAAVLPNETGHWMRTGDLGFFHQGQLYVTGRAKDLIIIRGRNLYPHDIEATVESQTPHLTAGRGAAFAVEKDGDERLIIVWELSPRKARDAAGLTDTVCEAVAEDHQVQPFEVVLIKPGTLPVTSSGKIRRRECSRQYLAGELESVAAPVSAAEAAPPAPRPDASSMARALHKVENPEARNELLILYLKETVARVMGVEARSLHANKRLTAMGLDSLTAVELQHRIELDLDVVLPMTELLEGPTLLELAEHLAGPQGASNLPKLAAHPNPLGRHPLSHGQRALWFHSLLRPDSAAYNVARALTILGEIDVPTLKRALFHWSVRHPALRTSFGTQNGEPYQQVEPQREPEFQHLDATEWSDEAMRAYLSGEAHRPFEQGPLLRFSLLDRPGGELVLLMVVHHICIDYWSLAILMHELGVAYRDFLAGTTPKLAPLSLQYVDYVHWQEEVLSSERGDALWSYWQKALPQSPEPLNLPTDHPRPPVLTEQGATHEFILPARLLRRLKRMALDVGTTLPMLFLAAYKLLLSRYSGQREIVVGTPYMGRDRAALADVVGYFVNPLPISADLRDNPSFLVFLERVRTAMMGAFQHQDYPFPLLVERLQPDRDESFAPIFQTMFLYQSHPPHGEQGIGAFAMGEDEVYMNLSGLEVESLAFEQRAAQFDLTLATGESLGERTVFSLTYNRDLFEPHTIAAMAGHYLNLLESILVHSTEPVELLSFLGIGEKRRIQQTWNNSALPVPEFLHTFRLIENQAMRTPYTPAVVFDESDAMGNHHFRLIEYHQLNERANILAVHLRAKGVGPERFVGIMLERSPEMIVAALAVQKAGGAYVPLDPTYPPERLAYMAEDAGIALLLTNRETARDVFIEGHEPLYIDSIPFAGQAADNPTRHPDALQPAYMIYTSGSTGKPKGVVISHRSLTSFVCGYIDRFHPSIHDRVLQRTSFSFDVSVSEIFPTLASGAGLVLLPKSRAMLDTQTFANFVTRHHVTIFGGAPSFLASLNSSAFRGVRMIISGGEALSPKDIDRFMNYSTVINGYGPTEATIFATYGVCRKEDKKPPIGRPNANTTCYILDRHFNPVPAGVIGELCVGGAGLARGYHKRPSMTAARFMPNPFDGFGERLYRTGDQARFLRNGEIDYMGRIDHQVKIRGFRIEPEEIETHLAEFPDVAEAVVVPYQFGAGDLRLVAYLATPKKPSLKALRAHLLERVPEYMVPASFTIMETLPLSPAGKVDRKNLPAPSALGNRENFKAPANVLQEKLATIWAEVLGQERVSVTANFFELGGHSLMAARMVGRIREALHVDLPLGKLFATPTIEGLAAAAEEALRVQKSDALPAIAPREPGEAPALSYAQERLWFLHQLERKAGEAVPRYNMPATLRLTGPVSVTRLEAALGAIVARHESLRTRFPVFEGQPQPRIMPYETLALPCIDLADRGLAQQLAFSEALRPFDLEHDPLFRFHLIRLAEEEHLLLATLHHIVGDGWSVSVLLHELEAHYRGEPLAELPVQYGDFAIWQRRFYARERLQPRLSYWAGQLSGLPELLQLPTDHPRANAGGDQGGLLLHPLDDGLIADLQSLGQRLNGTLFMVSEAIFSLLMSYYAGCDDLAMGTPIAGRDRAEQEDLIGLFVNTLVLRARIDWQQSFVQFLQGKRRTALDAFAHADAPFEMLVDLLRPERGFTHQPLVQVLFTLETESLAQLSLPLLTVEPAERVALPPKFDLSCTVVALPQGSHLVLEYDAQLFEQATIARLAMRYEHLLRNLSVRPDQQLARVAFFDDAERASLVSRWCPAGPSPLTAELQGVDALDTEQLKLVLLDRRGAVVARGPEGRVYLGGPLLQQHIERGSIDEDRLVANPLAEGERLLRTDFRARLGEDGGFCITGRMDRLIRLGGLRLDLAEIEASILSLPEIADAHVSVFRDEWEGPRLAAWLVSDATDIHARIAGELRQVLPDYQVPALYTLVPRIPKGADGTVDTDALPEPKQQTERRLAPRDERERRIIEIWQNLLGSDAVGPDDSFFELGGHSLLATRVLAHMHDAFGVSLPLWQFFENPTVAGLAELLAANLDQADRPPLSAQPEGTPPRTSFAQERMWFLDRLEAGHTATYNMPLALDLLGPFDADLLSQVLTLLSDRHQILRTTLDDSEGVPRPVLRNDLTPELTVVDLCDAPDALAAIREAEERLPFRLNRELPLRAHLLRLADEHHVLLFNMHHIASDGWSFGVLVDEVTELYRANQAGTPPNLPRLSVQYADYAAWQRDWLQGAELERQRLFWQQQLANIPRLSSLYPDRPRPKVMSFAGAEHGFLLDSQLHRGLVRLAREHGVTLFMMLQGLFAQLVSRYTGQTDIVLGTPVANRGHKDLEPLIGFFVNTLAVRNDCSGDPDFPALMERVRAFVPHAFAHQDLPFELVVEAVRPARDTSHTPIFQIMFVLQNVPEGSLTLPGLQLRTLPHDTRFARFDITCFVEERGEDLGIRFEYNSDLFQPTTIQRLGRHFRSVLEQMNEGYEGPLSRLELMRDAERHQLLYQFSGGIERGDWQAIAHYFEEVGTPRLYIMDRHGQLQPRGVPGELFITGLTPTDQHPLHGQEGCFVPNPFLREADEATAMLCRTVQMARLEPDGHLTLLGEMVREISAVALEPIGEDGPPLQGPTQALIAEIWSELLGNDSLGQQTDFFESGGHSLMATRVLVQLKRRLGIALPISDLFEYTVLADLAAHLDEVQGNAPAPVAQVAETDSFEPAVSIGQERLWFIDKLEREAGAAARAAYNMTLALNLDGLLDVTRLQAAISRVIERHSVLRTRFSGESGRPRALIDAPAEFPLVLFDLSHLDGAPRDKTLLRLTEAEGLHAFDLEHGPLLRVMLFRLSPDRHLLLTNQHHIVSDGWSLDVLLRELAVFYRDPTDNAQPVLPMQFAQYAAWQRQHLQGEHLQQQLAYWKDQLAGSPDLLQLPTDAPRPSVKTWAGAVHSERMPAEELAPLRALCQQHGTTLYIALESVFALLLGRYACDDDVPVGASAVNRNHPDTHPMIGYFVNSVVLRNDLSGQPSFAELLGRTRSLVSAALDHQEAPFEEVVEVIKPARSTGHSPLYQVVFSMLDMDALRLDLPGIEARPYTIPQRTAKFDLILVAVDEGDSLAISLEYNTGLFQRATAERLVRHFRTLVRQACAHPNLATHHLELMDDDERSRVLHQWNQTDEPNEGTQLLHVFIERQAERAPEAPALSYDTAESLRTDQPAHAMTYRELNQQADRLAGMLRRRGVVPDQFVAICLPRGLQRIVTTLAVIKAGGAWVPLDPNYPDKRLAYIYKSCGSKLLIADRASIERLDALNDPHLDLNQLPDEPFEKLPPVAMDPHNCCYAIYTSGSTGKPKGVAVSHRGACNMIDSFNGRYGLGPGKRMLHVGSYSFDISVVEVMVPLSNGATVVTGERQVVLPGPDLGMLIDQRCVTHTLLPPSTAAVLPERDYPSLELINLGGEAMPLELLRRFSRPNRKVVNGYGPTETTVTATIAYLDPDESEIHLGEALRNYRLYVLDRHGRPVPLGVPGELCIAGTGVARGYLNQAALTAERFTPNPFTDATNHHTRLYHTGDRVLRKSNGRLIYVGRLDTQIKLRGFRIELGEIETNISRLQGVKESVVLLRDDMPGGAALVGYVTPAEGANPTGKDLRDELARQIPAYLVPAAIVVMPEFPTTPVGKINRRALPLPELQDANRTLIAPASPLEGDIMAVFAEVLQLERISTDDNFFDLGGSSVTATRVHGLLQQRLEREFPLIKLFEHSTVQALADYLAGVENAQPAESGRESGNKRREAAIRKRQSRKKRRASID